MYRISPASGLKGRVPSVRKGEIIIDFDAEGRILGLEILGAKDVLREETLGLAQRP